jgi:hypothetical protein
MEREFTHSFLYDYWYLVIIGIELVALIWQVIGAIKDCKKYKYNWHTEEETEK